jgi:hypothetical protein
MNKKILLIMALYSSLSLGAPYASSNRVSGVCKSGAYLTDIYRHYQRTSPQPILPASIAGQSTCGTYTFQYLDPYSMAIKNAKTTVEAAEYLDLHDPTCRRCR